MRTHHPTRREADAAAANENCVCVCNCHNFQSRPASTASYRLAGGKKLSSFITTGGRVRASAVWPDRHQFKRVQICVGSKQARLWKARARPLKVTCCQRSSLGRHSGHLRQWPQLGLTQARSRGSSLFFFFFFTLMALPASRAPSSRFALPRQPILLGSCFYN